MSNTEEYTVDTPDRRRLPKTRKSDTTSFRIGEVEGYMQVGLFEDGTPGEVFLTVSKTGTTMGAFPDALAIAVSLGLQYGVPLEVFCGKYINWKFEPHGTTDDPDIGAAESIIDYIFRRLALDYLDEPTQRKVGALEPA